MHLIGRTTELADLAAAWARAAAGEPQLAVLWGRRRVGKTYLLTHFARDKRAVYFTATRQDSEDRQLRRFAERLREQLDDVRDLAPETFPSWEAALRFVVRLAESEPLLVVIDEAPRLTSSRADFADTVSAVWENTVREQRIMLVLSGSAVAAMEQMLGPQGGLHRRAGVERRMDPFPLVDAPAFLPGLAPENVIEAYAACGGYPLHLRRWSADRTTEQNLVELAFTPGGLLLRDAPDILSEDLDWRGGYERVLTAMAGGRGAGRGSPAGPSSASTTRWTGYAGPGTCASSVRSARADPRIPSTRSPTSTWPTGSLCCATTPTSSRAARAGRFSNGRRDAGRPTSAGSSRRRPATTPNAWLPPASCPSKR